MAEAKGTTPASGLGVLGHWVTGIFATLAAIIGIKGLDDIRDKIRDVAKRQMENLRTDRHIYERTLGRMTAEGGEWARYATILEQRRRVAERDPFVENRQVALITELLKGRTEDEQLETMRELALMSKLEFEARLRSVEDNRTGEVIRAAKHAARELRPIVQEVNQRLKRRVRARNRWQRRHPLPRTGAERRRYIIRREGFFRWLIGG
ncbi:hypothetical protein HYW67_03580 [Candidatus Parcubacteria bacterium]|nr:hypothetical protein [Candidatus Parcubacteria bacterium]